jgi:hypothetical protein
MLGREVLVLVVLGSTLSLTAQSSFGETVTDCRASPQASAPQGMHWYYRVDRTNNRHCWFLGSAGMYLDSHRIVAKPNRTPQSAAEHAWTPSLNQSVQLHSSQLASAGTVSAKTLPLGPSVGKRTTTDFAGRWLDLPSSVDLNADKPATPLSDYTDEHTSSTSGKQMPPSLFVAADKSGGLRHSAGTANFGSIFLVGALGALVFGGVLRLTRPLHAWSSLTTNELPHDPAIRLGELMGALRRVDEKVDSSRSSNRWPPRSHRSRWIGERQNERPFDFAVRPGQNSISDLVVMLP